MSEICPAGIGDELTSVDVHDVPLPVTLTTRPGLTTGLRDRDAIPNQLTFCICGGPGTPVTPSAKKR